MSAFSLGLAFVCALLSGCLAPLEPDVGEPIAGVCKNDDSDPDTDVSFADEVLPMLTMGCGCHDPKKGGSAISSVGFSVESYDKIMRGGANTAGDIVVPNAPCDSTLLQKMSEAPPFGTRMPTFGPYFTRTQMQTLHDWIAEGARDD